MKVRKSRTKVDKETQYCFFHVISLFALFAMFYIYVYSYQSSSICNNSKLDFANSSRLNGLWLRFRKLRQLHIWKRYNILF